MAQKTTLTLLGLYGPVQSFVAKAETIPPTPAPSGAEGLPAWELRFFDPAGNEIGRTVDFEYLNCGLWVNRPGYLEARLRGDHVLIDSLVHRCYVELWRKVPALGVGWYRHFSGVYLDQDRALFERKTMTIRAWGDLVLLRRRIVNYAAGVAGRSVFLGEAAESVMKDMVKYNITGDATTGNGRKRTGANWPGGVISIQTDAAGGNVVNWYCHGDNLLESLQDLAAIAGGDFDLIKTGAAAFEFRFYVGQRGTDRSGSVEFSLKLDNIGDPAFRFDRSKEGTVGAVWGQGEGTARDYVTRTGPDFSTDNDLEIYVSATDVEIGDTDGLNAAGDRALEEARARAVYTFTALQNFSSIYKNHYELGDLVTGVNPFTGDVLTLKVNGIGLALDGAGGEVIETELRTV